MLPFIFAASALQEGDSVTLMLFHDAVLLAVDGVGARLVPVGPPNRYEETAAHPKATLWACRPCVDARRLSSSSLDRRVNRDLPMPGSPESSTTGLCPRPAPQQQFGFLFPPDRVFYLCPS
jgi:sulfur relay (sulfurtransferase) complex TusBCD TusD component (DsrE family)